MAAETGAGWSWFVKSEEVEQTRDYLLSSGQWSDCTFLVGSGSNQAVIRAHKLILAIESPVFEAMFYGGLSERNDRIISIPDVPPDTFRALLQYIYTNDIMITDSINSACDLWYAAAKYMLPNLTKICYNYIWSYVGPRSVCQAYQLASLFDKKTIVDKCIQIISKNTKEVLNDSSFEDLELKTVITVCSLDHLTVDSELDLFHAVARYAEAQQRRQEGISSVDVEPPSKKLCLHHSATSDEMVLLPRAGSSSQTSPAVELHSKSPTEVASKPTADKEKIKKEEPSIREALQKIRFLSLTAQEFAEGPARSGLLTEAESVAVRSNISSRDSPVLMPAGFSECRERRQAPNDSVDEGHMAKPRPKPCTEPRSDATMILLPNYSNVVRGLESSERELFEDSARVARFMTCADADGTENLDQLVAAGGIPALVAALQHPWTGVQYDAAWAITNIACGEHAAGLPDAVPVLVGLLGHGGAVAEQAAWALGNIAGYNSYASDAVVNAGAVPALLAHMQPSTPSAALRTYVHTYRMICQIDIHRRWDEGIHIKLLSGVPNIENLLVLADEQVLAHACWALHHLIRGKLVPNVFSGTLPARISDLLRPAAAVQTVQTAALAVLGRMLSINGWTICQMITERCIEAGCLDHIVTFLKCGNPLQVAYAALAVSIILADRNQHFQPVLDKGVLDALVPALKGNNTCKYHAGRAINNFCERASPAQLGVLAASGALEPYCHRLTVSGDVCYNVLCSLKDLLQKVEQNSKPDLILKLRDIGLPQLLMTLLQDSRRYIRELAEELLRSYFSSDQ